MKVTTEGKGGDDHLSGQEGRAWSSRTLEDLRVQLEQFANDRCNSLIIALFARVNAGTSLAHVWAGGRAVHGFPSARVQPLSSPGCSTIFSSIHLTVKEVQQAEHLMTTSILLVLLKMSRAFDPVLIWLHTRLHARGAVSMLTSTQFTTTFRVFVSEYVLCFIYAAIEISRRLYPA